MREYAGFLLFTLAALASGRVAANDYCVDNASQLQQALTASASNGVSDTIRLAAATFASPGVDGFLGANETGTTLTIEGGYFSVFGICNVHVDDPTLTVIDGSTLRRGMYISSFSDTGALVVKNLSFHNGRQFGVGNDNRRGAGLRIRIDGNVTIERTIFRDNGAADIGGALYVSSTGGTIRLNTSLFVGNFANEAAAYYMVANSNFVFISNNTIAGNSAVAISNSAVGVHAGNSSVVMSNNVFWGNTLPSQNEIAIGTILAIDNNFERAYQNGAAGSVNNTSVDPKFADLIDYRLRDDSPLIDRGVEPQGGRPALDLQGTTRLQNGSLDLGPYENSLLFTDGFE